MEEGEIINQFKIKLKKELPPVVSRNELLNYFIYNCANGKGTSFPNSLTSRELTELALEAGLIIAGNTPLEIKVSTELQKDFKERSRKTFSNITKDKLNNNKNTVIKLYKDGASCCKISKMYGCNPSTIQNFLKKCGVELRGRSNCAAQMESAIQG